jgi:hypothetical protein
MIGNFNEKTEYIVISRQQQGIKENHFETDQDCCEESLDQTILVNTIRDKEKQE